MRELPDLVAGHGKGLLAVRCRVFSKCNALIESSVFTAVLLSFLYPHCPWHLLHHPSSVISVVLFLSSCEIIGSGRDVNKITKVAIVKVRAKNKRKLNPDKAEMMLVGR